MPCSYDITFECGHSLMCMGNWQDNNYSFLKYSFLIREEECYYYKKTSLNYWIKIVASWSSTTLKQKPKNNQNSNSKTYNVQIMPIYFLLFFKQKKVQMISKIIIQYISLTLLLMRAIYYFRHIRLLSICYSKDNDLLCRHYEYQTAMCRVFFSLLVKISNKFCILTTFMSLNCLPEVSTGNLSSLSHWIYSHSSWLWFLKRGQHFQV